MVSYSLLTLLNLRFPLAAMIRMIFSDPKFKVFQTFYNVAVLHYFKGKIFK